MSETVKAEISARISQTGAVSITLSGTPAEVLTAWGWLTVAICEKGGLSVEKLAAQMPELTAFLRRNIQSATSIDLSKLYEEGEGGKAP